MSFHPGLVSITFRPSSPEQIIDLCIQARIEGIEWGGDVHVPHGDLATARAVGQQTRDAGLAVSAYGSYYRAGVPADNKNPDFQAVLESAIALEAPAIRVWAGRCSPAQASDKDRRRIADDLFRIASLAAKADIQICTEYHANTLTETDESARKLLLEEARHENLATYWQTVNGASLQENLTRLDAVLDLVTAVHVFHWTRLDDVTERRPLAEGKDDWARYLPRLEATGRTHWLMLEFVRDDSAEQFLADAATLRQWIA